MMTSSNGNNFRVTGHLCGEFTVPGEFPAQRPVMRSFDVFYDLRLNERWVNNRDAGDLRRYRTHYDVTIMQCYCCPWGLIQPDANTICTSSKLPCFLDQRYPNSPLQWHHNERYGVSNHQRLECLLNRLFRRESKKTSKVRVTGLCEGNSPVTCEFRPQRTSNGENASFWWRHHANIYMCYLMDKRFLQSGSCLNCVIWLCYSRWRTCNDQHFSITRIYCLICIYPSTRPRRIKTLILATVPMTV